MFFDASKVLAWVTYPPYWVLLLVVAAVLLVRRPVAAAAAAGLAVVIAVGSASPAVADALQRWVEAPARDTTRPGLRYDVVVVPAGNAARLDGAAALVRSGRARYLLYSGRETLAEQRTVRDTLRALGVRDDQVVLEGRSRNTYENAVESARVVRERGWRNVVMVTSAEHVRRALASFQRAGLDPDVYPVERRTGPPVRDWWPSRRGLRATRDVLHEVIGIAAYRLFGYAV